MTFMALELDDKDMMVICLLFFKRDNFQNHLLDCSGTKPSS